MHESQRSLLDDPLVLGFFQAAGGAPEDYASQFRWMVYRDQCRRFARKFGCDPDEAEDVAQEVLIKVVSKVGRFPTRLPAWIVLHRLVEDRVRDIRRRSGTRKRGCGRPCVNIEDLGGLGAEGGDQDTLLDLYAALGCLTEKQRKLIHYKFFLGMAHDEIAPIMGYSSAQVVQQTCSRTLAKLRNLLAG